MLPLLFSELSVTYNAGLQLYLEFDNLAKKKLNKKFEFLTS